jgi:hypothetical protein
MLHVGIFYTCRKATTWDRRLYFPSEGRHAEDFFALKIRQLRPGVNPQTWVPKASTLPLDHRSRPRQTILNSKLCWSVTWQRYKPNLFLLQFKVLLPKPTCSISQHSRPTYHKLTSKYTSCTCANVWYNDCLPLCIQYLQYQQS